MKGLILILLVESIVKVIKYVCILELFTCNLNFLDNITCNLNSSLEEWFVSFSITSEKSSSAN